jgi:hypothetical protein
MLSLKFLFIFLWKNPNVKVEPKYKIKEPSLVWCLCKAFGGKFIAGSFLKVIHDLMLFAGPVLLG